MKMKPIMMVMMALMLLSLYFAGQGVLMHAQVPAGEDALHALQAEYFNLNKAEREGVPTGHQLNQKLVQIQQAPSSLMQLKLIGVGKMLTGIFVLLFGILIALIMMPVRLGKIIKGH